MTGEIRLATARVGDLAAAMRVMPPEAPSPVPSTT